MQQAAWVDMVGLHDLIHPDVTVFAACQDASSVCSHACYALSKCRRYSFAHQPAVVHEQQFALVGRYDKLSVLRPNVASVLLRMINLFGSIGRIKLRMQHLKSVGLLVHSDEVEKSRSSNSGIQL